MDLGPGGLSSPGPSGFGGGYNATGTGYDASGGSNEPVMFPEQLNLPGPEVPKVAQTIQRAIDSPFGRGAEFAFKTALSSAFPAYGLITLAQDIYNAGGVSPYFQQQKETLQNLLNQPTITAPPVITTGGDNQPIIPMQQMQVAETPTDVDGTLSDLDMYIQNLRARTPTPFALDPRFAAAEGGVARQAYGLGSLVRKITKPIKKILKSDVGKAALAAGTIYGLGGGTFFGKSIPGLAKAGGFKFGNIMPNLFGVGAAGDYDKGARGILGTLRLTPGYGTREMTGFGKLAALAGPSILAGLSTEEEEDDLSGITSRKDTSGLRELIARYPELRFQVQPQYQLAANGGRMGYEEGGNINPADLPMSREGLPTYEDIETGEEVEYPYKNKEMSSAPDIDAELFQMYLDAVGSGQIPRSTTFDQYKELMNEMSFEYRDEPYGPFNRQERTMANEGGLMSLGGNEMDLRGGGFVPIGKQEKADDVPARLSKNEFVFTADAVRAAGGGDVDKGADLMYKTMKDLESRVG